MNLKDISLGINQYTNKNIRHKLNYLTYALYIIIIEYYLYKV